MNPRPGSGGWIETITGCMFSGKSEELIRQLRRAVIARQAVQIFKPRLDDRFDEQHIVTHTQVRLKSQAVLDADELRRQVADDTEVVGVDEAQFFDQSLVDVATELAAQGRRVIVAGLDLDYRGEPFEPMPQLMAVSEYVSKQLAICMVCGDHAHFSQRLTSSRERIEVGAGETYEARCRRHFDRPE